MAKRLLQRDMLCSKRSRPPFFEMVPDSYRINKFRSAPHKIYVCTIELCGPQSYNFTDKKIISLVISFVIKLLDQEIGCQISNGGENLVRISLIFAHGLRVVRKCEATQGKVKAGEFWGGKRSVSLWIYASHFIYAYCMLIICVRERAVTLAARDFHVLPGLYQKKKKKRR